MRQAPADGPDGRQTGDIGLVSLSTTLATNAVVEGVGGRVGLVMIGFDEAALERADLARALGRDPVAFIMADTGPMAARRRCLTVMRCGCGGSLW